MASTTNVSLADMIAAQAELQTSKMKGGDPRHLVGDERATFLTWNAFALTDELHEAFNEIGWKPWATSRHINRELVIKEMVDAFHFFMNILLAVSPGMDATQIAQEFTSRYYEKNKINGDRQDKGYDGVTTKCLFCKRELSDVGYFNGPEGEIYGKCCFNEPEAEDGNC